MAPVDLPTADRLAAPAAATASTVTGVTSPADGPTTIATPALPEPARESPAPERAAVESMERTPDLKPGAAETIVAHTPAIPLPAAPSLAEDRPPTTIPVAEAQQDRAAAVAVETENGSDQEPWETTSALKDGPETAGRATDGPIATLPSPAGRRDRGAASDAAAETATAYRAATTDRRTAPGRVARQGRGAAASSPKNDAGEARQACR